jgi:hypothetical protein
MKSFRSTGAELVFASTILFLSLSAIEASALSSRYDGYSDSMIRSSHVNDLTHERTEWLSSSVIRPVSVLEGELTDSLSQLRFFFENDGEGLAAIVWSEGLEFKGGWHCQNALCFKTSDIQISISSKTPFWAQVGVTEDNRVLSLNTREPLTDALLEEILSEAETSSLNEIPITVRASLANGSVVNLDFIVDARALGDFSSETKMKAA